MSNEHHSKKHNFAPYIIAIIVAIGLIAAGNAIVVYNYARNTAADNQKDHILMQTQQNLISYLAEVKNQTKQDVELNQLYHGQILYLIHNVTLAVGNNTRNLDSLIIGHNEMIKAIENATGVHPVINKITNVHNSYCTVNEVYVPKACPTKIHHK